MPRYRKNTKNKQKNKNKKINNNNKKDNEPKENKEGEGIVSELEENVDINPNEENVGEQNELCVEIESCSNCDYTSQSEHINIKENRIEPIQIDILHEQISTSDDINENVPVIFEEIESIDSNQVKFANSVDLINEPNNNERLSDTISGNEENDASSQPISLMNSESSDCVDETNDESSCCNQLEIPVSNSKENQNIVDMDSLEIQDDVVDEDASNLNPDLNKNHNQDYKARRESKRAALENHFLPQFINPRYLDSIKEENVDIEKDKTNAILVENSTIPHDEEISYDNPNEPNILKDNTEKTITENIFNSDIILEEIEPSFAEIIDVTDDVDEEFNSLLSNSDDVIDLIKIVENNDIENKCKENKISDQVLENDFIDTNKNINIISTTLIHPTQIEKLTTNMTSHTNPNENKYIEKYKYPEPPATKTEKPENNLEINCEIVSQKILNAAEEECADKSIENFNKNNIQYTTIEDINNFIEKLENNPEESLKTIEFAIRMNETDNNIDGNKPNEINKNVQNQQSTESSALEVMANNEDNSSKSSIKPLRLICTETLASMPYGEDILEELAQVAKSLSHLTEQHQDKNSLYSYDNTISQVPISNKSALADLASTVNMLKPSIHSPNSEHYGESTKNDYLSSSINNYTNSLNGISDTPTVPKDFQGGNEFLENTLHSSNQEKSQKIENVVSSTNLLPKSDDAEHKITLTKSLFYNNDPKKNQNFLASVHDASKQTIDGNFLNKINKKDTEHVTFNTQKQDLSDTKPQSSYLLDNTTRLSSNENNTKMFSNEKDNKSNERIINIEIKKSPFCGQLRQTASKLYYDKDKLSSDDIKIGENDSFWHSKNKIFENCKNENKNNLEEKFNKIMSDFKLDTKYSEGVPKTPPRKEFNQAFINRNENTTRTRDINTNESNFSYDEFRRRAKEKATQRAKSEYFEREHFFKDFNRFSEIYNDDFFNKFTDVKNQREPKIVNIPIKIETKEAVKKQNPEPQAKTSVPKDDVYQVKENETGQKVLNIPITIEKSEPHEIPLKSETKKADDSSETSPYFNKYVNRSPDNKIPLKEFETRVWSKSGKIKAPRLSGSTSSLPFTTQMDAMNDYSPYRSCSRRKHYISCHSLIDETPITSSFFTQKLSMPSLLSTDYLKENLKTEFEKLENDRHKLIEEMNEVHEKRRMLNKELRANRAQSLSEEEIFRQQMRNEWLNKIAEQEERRMQKTIKLSKIDTPTEESNRDSKKLDITDEFLKRVEERRSKLCMPSDSDWESGAESQPITKSEDTVDNEGVKSNVKVVDGEKEKDLKNLPKHLVEFAEFVKKFEEEHLKECRELKGESQQSNMFAPKFNAKLQRNADFWSADQKSEGEGIQKEPPTPPPLPLWSPIQSPTSERKEFRPVKFESPTLPRRYVQLNSAPQAPPPWSYTDSKNQQKFNNSSVTNPSENIKKEGAYIDTEKKHPFKADTSVEPNEFTNTVKNDYMTVLESENDRSNNMAQLSRKKLEGVGPITKDGIPICLRSEVDQNNQHQWYKTMFNTLHKVHDGDDSVIIRYKSPRGRYLYKSKGYMSEPETNDSNYSTMKYTNKLGRRTGGNADDDQIYGTMSNLSQYGTYRRQPGRIEDFTPCHATSSEKKKPQQWDQHKLSSSYTEGNLSRVLKEQGYESESNLVIRKIDEPQSSPLSPVEQKQVYRNVQSGGEPPLNGFRKPAPEKPKEEKNFDYISFTSELTKNSHNKACQQKETIPYSTHRSITTQNSVSFLPITKILIQPPTPPNRSSSRTRTSDSLKSCFNPRKSTPSSERHKKCFDTDFFTKPSDKFKTISLRKNKCFDTLFRSQSGGAVNKIVSKTEKKIQSNGANKSPISSATKSTSRFTKRPSSLSPIAFGRSCSKERAFAVEKRRLEESLPLCKKSFTASTNILRDPSLKSPNEVKKAVQSFAHIHSTDKKKVGHKKLSPTYSKSINSTQKVPCMRKKVTVVNKRKDKLLKYSYSMVSRGIDISNIPPKNNSALLMCSGRKSPIRQDNLKTNSTISLTRTNSTYSVDSTESKAKETKRNAMFQSHNYAEEEMKERLLNQQDSIRSTNFFQNLFLREVLPTLQSDSSTTNSVQEKTQLWSRFPAKSEPSLQRSRLYLSQNQPSPGTKFISCKHETCQRSQSLHPSHSEKQKIKKRSKSEPRSKLHLSEHSSTSNLTEQPNNLLYSTKDYVNSAHKNKRFSPTREVRIPVREIQPESFSTNIHELENQNQPFQPNIKFDINSEAMVPYSSTISRKKTAKSFSPTREIRVSPDEYHSYCPYSYTGKSYDNRSLSPTRKLRVANQNNISGEIVNSDNILDKYYDTSAISLNTNNEICSKAPRSKSFSPTREIRVCPEQNKSLCYRPIRLSSPTRQVVNPAETRKLLHEVEKPQSIDLRSPSHRRIQSFRDNRKCETKSIIRASSLSSADDRKKQNLPNLSSQPSLNKNDNKKTTQQIKENKKHSTKFLDLNNFYSNIERFGQLERATSATDLHVVGKKRNTVDYDEWKKIRAHKRAEKELSYVLRAIKQDEREKDFLFRPKELEEIKWTESSDCGLRCREKSVEDLRENFEKTLKRDKPDEKKMETYSKKDIYKPHWRAMTVADLATNMEEKYNSDNIRQSDRTLGFSKKIISTLSKEQIHKIKDQLNEIYSTSLTDETYKYSVKNEEPPQQIQKLNYTTSSKSDFLDSDLINKKEEIMTYKSHSKPKKDERRLQNSKSCDRILMKSVSKDPELDETEKKKLSKSLSQEIQTRGLELRKSKSNHVILPVQKPKNRIIIDSKQTLERSMSILPSTSQKIDRNDSFRNISSEKIAKPNTLDDTKATVDENVNKKIKYFEEIKTEVPPKTIYHAREYSSPDEEEVIRSIERKIKAKENEKSSLLNRKHISTSASDLKELYGEKELYRINYSGPSDMMLSYTTYLDSNNSFSQSDYKHGTVKSFENVYRSRSMSPIRERTYKKFWDNINTGSVKRIKNKFENIHSGLKGPTNYSNCLRKIKSDPALNKQQKSITKTTIKPYENSDVSSIAYKFETAKTPSRGRPRYRKNLSPIPRVQIKKTDLMMPHIDIISKTASLKQELGKTSPIHPQLHRSGKVDRIRCKFDHCSLLSQIYTSSPDISELKDISTYLRGEWIAHKFPNKIDNEKTIIEDKSKGCNRIQRKIYRRPSSTSPLPSKANVTSILKPYYSSFGNDTFESILYRPKTRYPENYNDDQQHLTGVAFKENDIVPSTPPLPSKGVTFNDNGIDTETYFRCLEDILTKSPIRYECKDILQDEELAVQQRESLAKIYQKEREKKHVQELQNMNSRHTHNFTPTQKYEIPLNRYDDFNADLPEPKKVIKTLVKALYNFNGESDRELSFKKGDVMYVTRLVDTNWYEGEHNGRIGLLPANYIQKISKNGVQVPQKKISEGQGRAKFNFQAQSAVELSLNKGELVTLIRQVDENWFEGKIANRKGIFPVSYIEVLMDIGAEDLNKPLRTPILHSSYQPSLDALRTTLNHEFNTLTNGQPATEILKEAKTQILHVDTDSQPIPFRALYKYRPQNNDELELHESDIVYVLEMCDDGWYVGTSQRTGCFGTFPGNYVERI